MYPKEFNDLIALFERLPGVGNKTALRYAFKVLSFNENETAEIAQILTNKKNIKKCKICGFLSNSDTCLVCSDDKRDKSTIMVLAYPQDLVAIESTNSYNGQYHVLNGLISSTKGIFPEDINIDSLIERIDKNIKEVIIALSPTTDGEITSLYLDKLLKNKNITVTRLANGLPMGSSIDYADNLTLIKALDNRTKINQ